MVAKFLRGFHAREFERAFGVPFSRTAREMVQIQDQVMAILENLGYEGESAWVEVQSHLDNGPPAASMEVRVMWLLWASSALQAADLKRKQYRRLCRLACLAGLPRHLLEATDRRVQERGLEEGIIFAIW